MIDEAIKQINEENDFNDGDRQRLAELKDSQMYDSLIKLLKNHQKFLIHKLIQADENPTVANGLRGSIEALGNIEAWIKSEIERLEQD